MNTEKNKIYSQFKSECEGTMTVYALNYIFQNNIHFDMLYKISGRYWLTEKFNYGYFDNDSSVIHLIQNNKNNAFTCVYKLTFNSLILWFHFLIKNAPELYETHGFERIFAIFIDELQTKTSNNIEFINYVGVSGYVSVCGTYIDM
jgi:hypothetical protein